MKSVEQRIKELKEKAMACRKTKDALQKDEERFRSLVELSNDWIWEVDKNGVYTYASPKIKDLLGYEPEQVIGKRPFDLMPPDTAKHIEKKFQDITASKKAFERLENVNLHRDGRLVVLETSGVPIFCTNGNLLGYRGIDHDITERKQIEEELIRHRNHLEERVANRTSELQKSNQQLQKEIAERKRVNEALLKSEDKFRTTTTSAEGIAHDFNNILSAIMANAEMALIKVPKHNRIWYNIDQIRQAGHRAGCLIKKILDYSRHTDHKLGPTKVGPIVKEALRLVRASLPPTIEICQRITSDRDIVIADPTQIHQVVMNLCTNAHHAMLGNAGVLEVRLTNVDLAASSVAKHSELGSGKYLKLCVRDTGHGIDLEVAKRIFDPYFTTKDKGMGTGLGLAMVHSIVKLYGGTIHVESEPNKGSTFIVFLPLAESKAEL